MNRRKTLFAFTGGAALTLVYPVFAQVKKPVRIAVMSMGSAQSSDARVEIFRKEMRAFGYVEGRDVVYDYRWADGNQNRIPQLIAELARGEPHIILTSYALVTRAAMDAAPAAVVLMVYGSDPVGNKLVASLAHPGGRVTGLSNLGEGTVSKMLELLHTMAPQAQRVALLLNPKNMTARSFRTEAETAAQTLGLSLVGIEAAALEDFGPAFDRITHERVKGIVVSLDAVYLVMRPRLIELVARAKIAAVYGQSEFVEDGGLMSYGASVSDAYRRSATFADKIIKGANPGDLPVEQPTRFELVINLTTAKALGLTIPPSLLLRADQVVQ